jgi:hypothetical protein
MTNGPWSLPVHDVLTSRRSGSNFFRMSQSAKRATVYFEEEVHRALRMKAAATDRSLSDMVNEAVKLTLAEDAEDLEAFEKRKDEPSARFEEFVKGLKARGAI